MEQEMEVYREGAMRNQLGVSCCEREGREFGGGVTVTHESL